MTVTYPNLSAIDDELQQIHTVLRTMPMTSEDKRARIKRMAVLLQRRFNLPQRAATMIEKC